MGEKLRVTQGQWVHLESWSMEFRSDDRMCLLKAAMVVSSLIFFGMMAHIS